MYNVEREDLNSIYYDIIGCTIINITIPAIIGTPNIIDNQLVKTKL